MNSYRVGDGWSPEMKGPRRSRAHDISGRLFGRLLTTGVSTIQDRRRVFWLCVCDCGENRWVLAQSLTRGATRSCGCLNDETRRAGGTHGATKNAKHTPEYASWHSMSQRCSNPTNNKFERYGGRGIAVCPQWADSFEQFLADMGPRPEGTSLERKRNNDGYGPDNCVWATIHAQNRNTSRTRLITFGGETMCLEDWRRRLDIPHATLHYRIRTWGVERALTSPKKGS